MPRATVRAYRSSSPTPDLDGQLEDLRRTVGRLRRAAHASALATSVGGPMTSLTHRVSRFSLSGNDEADRVELAELDRQARSLLSKANAGGRNRSAA
jgi:hypothetical protein